jgi:hypothetical protein
MSSSRIEDRLTIDAAGIRLLLRLLAAPHSRLVDVPPPVNRLLRIVDLHHLVEPTACSTTWRPPHLPDHPPRMRPS